MPSPLRAPRSLLKERLHPDGMIQKALQGPRHWVFLGEWLGFRWVSCCLRISPCPSRLQESELLRLKAFILFGKLARVVGMSKKHFFKGEVKKAWIPLMLHSQDPCFNAAQVRHTLGFTSRSGARCPPRKQVLGSAGLVSCRIFSSLVGFL